MREEFHFSLFLVGKTTPRSLNTLNNLEELCRVYLQSNFTLEVIDVTLEPDRAELAKIIATPTLLWSFGAEHGKLVGDLSHGEKIISLLQSFVHP